MCVEKQARAGRLWKQTIQKTKTEYKTNLKKLLFCCKYKIERVHKE